jgi:adenosine kinase
MINYSGTCKARGIDYIFDPGQSLPMWDSRDLIRCIEGSRIMISNDYELELVITGTGLDKKKLLQNRNELLLLKQKFGYCSEKPARGSNITR